MFVGDPHGRYEHIIASIKKSRPDEMIMLGDMCYDTPIDVLYKGLKGIYWIHGNHDTDSLRWYESLFESTWFNQSLHGSVKSLSGVRVAGLGGVFRPKIWNPDSGVAYQTKLAWEHDHQAKKFNQLRRKHKSSIWLEDYEYLASQQADILITHEAPDCHKYGFKTLDKLAKTMGVKLIIHGHHHTHYKAELENGIAVVGLGLAQVALMDTVPFRTAVSSDEIYKSFKFGMSLYRERDT